jgi:RNA polymerase sigma factor (sigma-70 family)
MKRLSRKQKALVRENAELAGRIAWHMRNVSPIPDDELVQLASEGLMIAAKAHDPDKGASFRTYAWKRAVGHIMDKTEKFLRESDRIKTANIDDWDLKGSGADPLEILAGKEFYDKMLQPLSFRDRRIVEMRIDGCSMKEIGQHFGLCESRICQILNMDVFPLLRRRYHALMEHVDG